MRAERRGGGGGTGGGEAVRAMAGGSRRRWCGLAALLAALWAAVDAAGEPSLVEAPPPSEPPGVEEPAWRELWYGSLEALHREPVLNNTQEDVLAQLGAVAFLHCPVRHLGERGVGTHSPTHPHPLSPTPTHPRRSTASL